MRKKEKKDNIISNIKVGSPKVLKKQVSKAKPIIIKPQNLEPKKEGKIKRSYKAIRNFFLGRKSEYENIFQYIIRQFLFPDSRGKPSLTATFFVWVMILISYVTYITCTLAMRVNTEIMDNGKVSETYVGFTDTIIYLYIVIVGYLGYMFMKRENQEKLSGETQGNIITDLIGKAKSFITKK
ncbi:MAG: hypothetical protein QXM96_03900 [Candidatus Woesearchaeota archaeon]